MKHIITSILILTNLLSFSQNNFRKEIKTFQEELNKQYADTAESPLTKEDLLKFKHLDFYAINKKYRVKAKFIRTENTLPFKMKTTTNRAPIYEKYGEVEFVIDGKTIKLSVYQSHRLRKIDEYKDYLSLPFTDETSGKTSYAGGRYVDLTIPSNKTIIIDFNKAYNPYCAYNHKYSCVIPPAENHIPIEIKAGVMKYKKH
jgi:uncharacterized protein (DUF1684 family)